MTVDTAHTVLTGGESRQQTYVALTRSRRENHMYVATAHTGDAAAPQTFEAINPAIYLDVLTGKWHPTSTNDRARTSRLSPALCRPCDPRRRGPAAPVRNQPCTR